MKTAYKLVRLLRRGTDRLAGKLAIRRNSGKVHMRETSLNQPIRAKRGIRAQRITDMGFASDFLMEGMNFFTVSTRRNY